LKIKDNKRIMANANVRSHLSETDVWQAVDMVEKGARHREVGEVFCVDHTVIIQAWARFEQHGTPVRRHGGRKRVTTEDEYKETIVKMQPNLF
jgi:transposase